MNSSDAARQHYYLHAMGVERWLSRGVEVDAVEALAPAAVSETASFEAGSVGGRDQAAVPKVMPPVVARQSSPEVGEAAGRALSGLRPFNGGWSELRQAVVGCQGCALHRSRRQTVFGVGDEHADWMLVGEAPGEQEDLHGEPFVGPAGKLLDAMLMAVGRSREQVYIANILKCRPPRNRDPSVQEAASCRHYLERQIELVAPRVIMAVGPVAAQNLLATDRPMRELRGRVHRYRDIPLIIGYHPAYLLRSPGEKRKAWQDLQLVMRLLASGGEQSGAG